MFKTIAATMVLLSSQVSADNYDANIRSDGTCFVGKTCYAVVNVTPKGDMHINTAYPTRFKIGNYPNASFDNPLVTKDNGSVNESSILLKFPFVPKTCGNLQIGGTLYFSVCNGSSCHMERIDLDTTIATK